VYSTVYCGVLQCLIYYVLDYVIVQHISMCIACTSHYCSTVQCTVVLFLIYYELNYDIV
jgi:hypothetical protein